MKNKKINSYVIITLLLSSSLGILFRVTPTVSAATTDFDNFMAIIINSDFIDDNLTNFPIWFYNTSDNWKINETSFTFFQPDNSTECNWELEYFNYTTGTIGAWVNISSISSTTNTTFYIYYDNSNSTDGGEYNPENTWDSNYILVNHMTDLLDSTSYDNDGVNNGTDNITGKLGLARNFVASNSDHVTFDPSPTLNASGWNVTIEAWVKSTNWTTNTSKYITYQYHHTTFLERLNASGDSVLTAYVSYENNAHNDWNCTSLDESEWQYVAFNYSNSGDWNNLFVNDELVSTITPGYGTANLDNVPFYIGMHYTVKEFWDGGIDEVRYSNISRSRAWINATYHSTNMTTGFLTFEDDNFNPVISNPSPTNGSTVSTSPTLCVTINDTDGDTMTITWYEGNRTTFNEVSVYEDVHAGQGVCVDDEYLYTTNTTVLYKYNLSTKVLVGSYAMADDDTNISFDHLGGLVEKDGILYITMANYPSAVHNGSIVEVWSSNLTFKDEHILGSYYQMYTDGIDYREMNGTEYFWVRLTDGNGVNGTVLRTETDFNFSDDVTYDMPNSSTYYYQGLEWYGDYMITTGHDTANIYLLQWNGSGFDYITNMSYGAGTAPYANQGVDYHKSTNKFYFVQRNQPDGRTADVSVCRFQGWLQVQQNTSVTNGTYCFDYNNASADNFTYYWRVHVSDGHGGTANKIYYFNTVLEYATQVCVSYDTGVTDVGSIGNSLFSILSIILIISSILIIIVVLKRNNLF